MGKQAEGFQFHLKFRQLPSGDQKYDRITALLDKYAIQVPADLQQPFRVQGPQALEKPFLTDEQQTRLKDQSTRFFRDMASEKFTLWDLQRYKEQFKGKNPKTGDNSVDPKIAWQGAYEGVERTLMGGRTLMIMDVWKQTMIDFFSNHPEAVGVVYGQMDIGSWVKMNVDGLGFAADIDFSTVATDAATNKALHTLFGENLKRATGLGMIPIDVVHTSHGLAGAEVFIGEWGKAFAEVDMLRRGKWKMLEVVKNENGQVTDIRTIEKEGKELFIEKGTEQELKAQKTDPQAFDPKLKYPKLSIDMEPMLSLEMLRHAVHDIEHGPFEGGQKIIKMIKYTERSFFMIKEGLADVPVKDQMLYFNLSPEEQRFMTLCDEVIKNKSDAKKIATLLEAITGKELKNADQVALIVDDIVLRSKQAMLKNANQAFGYRIRNIAQIEDETKRYAEADAFLKQLETEFQEGYKVSGTEIPASMKRAHTILVDLRAGKISPELMNARLEELNRIMENEYKVDKSFVERLVGDPWKSVTKYLTERGYGPDAVTKIVTKFKESFVSNWRQLAPEYAQKSAISAYEYANHVNGKLNTFHEHLSKTKAGKVLNSELLNSVDNTVALYDAWMSGKDLYESSRRVTWTIGTNWAQGRWPFLSIPLGIYNSYETKSVAPAAMAASFYLFPMAGQVYMVTNLVDRLVITNVRDYTFRGHMDKLSTMAVTDGQGHVVRFKVPRAMNTADSLETEPDISPNEPARTAGIKTVFYSPEFIYNPDIKYFEGLIPKNTDYFGLYKTKLDNLITLFSFDSEFQGYLVGLKKFKEDKEGGYFSLDALSTEREKLLDSLQLVIEDRLWASVFGAIESTKRGERKGEMDKLESTLIGIQDSLFLDDFRMKKIGKRGLLITVKQKIEEDPMYKEALKSDLSAGTAYGRVAVPVMENYISSYRRIQTIQDNIFKIWQPFGVDASKIQEDPMRLLLLGGLSGSPMLTTDLEKDMDVAVKSFEAHTKRAGDIRFDLANALGRPINDKEDREHLRMLGQYGFGMEHLIDARTDGRSPLFKDPTGAIQQKFDAFSKAYREYLEKLKETPSVKLKLQLKAENETMETMPITAEVSVIDEKGKPVVLPPDIVIEWFRSTGGKAEKVGDGNSITESAVRSGTSNYTAVLTKKGKDRSIKLDAVSWSPIIKPYNLKDPNKGLKINLPSVIKQYDIIDVSAEFPSIMSGRISNCSWGSEVMEDSKDCGKAKLQYIYENTGRDKDGKQILLDSISVGVNFDITETGKTFPLRNYVSKKVKYQHMTLAVSVSDIWDGGSGTNWVAINRKPMKAPARTAPWADKNESKSRASASASVNVKKGSPFAADIKTPEALKAYVDKEYGDPRNSELQTQAISIGDFKGYGIYKPARFSPGGWSDAGYRDCGAGVSFRGMVMKGKAFLEVSWTASASGAFDNVDKPWMMGTLKALESECKSIISGMSMKPDGRLTKSPYTGPKLDGSDYPQVIIQPNVDTIHPGSKVIVKAVIKNDKPEYGPYRYSWTGSATGNISSESVQLNADRPGKQSVSVSVDGNTSPGSASMDFVVAPLKVKITKLSPSINKIIVGMPVEFRADFIGTLPAGRKLQYLWQPHPEEKFEPFEGTSAATKVVFTKPGNKKIWVQVLDKTTEEAITMGESEQIDLVVEKPSFSISFNPAKAVVGQQVTAKVSTNPDKLEAVNYRWMPLPANAQLLRESQDASEIVFYAKDALQIPLEVLAVVKGSGEELGNVKAYFNAERYNVSVQGPNVQGPKPMIWKPGVGVVEVDKEIAVHQIVEFKAVVSPQPTVDLTYNWQVTEGNASISNPTSRDARVTALETGNVQVTVTVRDKNGVVLGTALGVFNASINQEMLSGASKQKQLFDDKLQQARQSIRDGDLDNAVKIGMELKGMNAKDAAPLMNELSEACKKASKEAAYERDFELAIKRCEQALQCNPADAEAKSQLEQNKKWAAAWPAVLEKGREMESNIQHKNLPAAQKNLVELNKLQLNMPGQMGNKWSKELDRKFTVLLKRCDSAYQSTREQWTENFKANDFENGLKGLEAFRKEWTAMPESMKEIESSIGLCKSRISENQRIYDEFLITKAKFEKGQPLDPKITPASINYQAANKFSIRDPRRKEMEDFANSMDNRKKGMIANRDKAAQLKKEGLQAESEGQKETALEKYKESVSLLPDAELDAKIKKLEPEVAASRESRNKADALWNEGDNLMKKSKSRKEGLAKMKESMYWWNSPERIDILREKEREVNGTYSNKDLSGEWKHGNTETFNFASVGDGRYTATEKGFDNARGSLSMIGDMGIIQYTVRNGAVSGQYILKVSTDGSTALGRWKDSRGEGGERTFVRAIPPTTVKPEVKDATKPVEVKTEEKKKKKSFTDVLDDINKGLDEISSVLGGNNPPKPQPTEPPKPSDKGVNPADANREEKIYTNGNIYGVSNGPTKSTVFTLSKDIYITRIENYHYFNNGQKPGTIAVRSSNGKTYGPWTCYGILGQGGVQNATWVAQPNMILPAGSYTVIDSDPSTWSHNSNSKGEGFTTVWASRGKTASQPSTQQKDKGGYTIEDVHTGGGVSAEKIFITGDIDNLGFGFPQGFDVFSGNSTPSHGFPWKTDPSDAAGTDRIMIGTGSNRSSDGYSSSTSRPDNLPQAITLNCPVGGIDIRSAVIQLFVDDFQAVAIGSKFTVTINRRRATFIEDVINTLNQTGPIGKLISLKVPSDFMNEIHTGRLVIYIDDATSGHGDGYAVDFIRLIINPTGYTYTGTISGVVYRPDGQPAAGASISAGGMINTTANTKGEFILSNVPAGMVSIKASYNGHHHTTINADLSSGKAIKITIRLPAD